MSDALAQMREPVTGLRRNSQPGGFAVASPTAPSGQPKVPLGCLTSSPSWPTEADEPLASQERCSTEHVLRRDGLLPGNAANVQLERCQRGRTVSLRQAGVPKPTRSIAEKGERRFLPTLKGWGFRAAHSVRDPGQLSHLLQPPLATELRRRRYHGRHRSEQDRPRPRREHV